MQRLPISRAMTLLFATRFLTEYYAPKEHDMSKPLTMWCRLPPICPFRHICGTRCAHLLDRVRLTLDNERARIAMNAGSQLGKNK